MAITDLIAKGGTPDPGQTTRSITEASNRIMDLRTKAAELQDFKREAPARRAEYDVRETKAKQENEILTEYGDKIKESTARKIDNEIATLRQNQRWTEMQEIDSVTQSIRGPEEWDMVKDNVAPALLRKYDLEPDKGYEENKTAIDYLTRQVQYNLEHRQAMELASLKGQWANMAAASRAGYTPETTGTLPTGDYFGQFMLDMEGDPEFNQLIGTFGNPGNSPEFQQATGLVTREFDAITKRNLDMNRARAKQGLESIRISKQDAAMMAKFRTKAYLFGGIESKYPMGFGGPQIELMSPEEAQEAEMEWRRTMYTSFMRDEEFKNLPQEDQERVLHNIYMKEKMVEYREAHQKLGGRINSR